MYITQGNSASINSGGLIFLTYDAVNDPNLQLAPSENLAQVNSNQFLSHESTISAVDIGRYSVQQLIQLAQGNFAGINTGNQPVINIGQPKNGYYSRRNLYVEPGTINVGGRVLSGEFIDTQDFFVNGQPQSTNPTNSAGQFPVNGSYFLNSEFRPMINTPQGHITALSAIQYPLNSSDPITAQFNTGTSTTGTAITGAKINVQGNLNQQAPVLASSASYINGQYIANLFYRKNAVASLQPTGLQSSPPANQTRGQILVNGENLFQGTFNTTIGSSNFPISQTGTVLVSGSYNTDGSYAIGGQNLGTGQNTVQGFSVTPGGILIPVAIALEGTYTSGGQFVVYSQASDPRDANNVAHAVPSNNFQLIQNLINGSATMYDDVISYLQNVSGLITSALTNLATYQAHATPSIPSGLSVRFSA